MPKIKIPRIQRDQSGRRFIVINRKRVMLSDQISERQLIKFIIGRLTKSVAKPKIRRVVIPKAIQQIVEPPTDYGHYPVVNTDPKSLENLEERLRPAVAESILKDQMKEKLKLQAGIEDVRFSNLLNLLPGGDEGKKQMEELMVKFAGKRASEIAKMRNDFLTKNTQVALVKVATDNGIQASTVNRLAKEKVLEAIEKQGAINFGSMWDQIHLPKIPLKMKPPSPDPASASASSSSSTKTTPQRNQSGVGQKTNLQTDDRRGHPAHPVSNKEIQKGVKGEFPLGLSTDQLNGLMSKYPNYLGAIASDEIRSLDIQPQTELGFILNKDASDKEGSHWVAVYSDGKKTIEYYDSFAKPPTQKFMSDLRWVVDQIKPDTYLKFKQNKIIDQDADSTNCGFHSSKFLIDRFRGRPFAECSGFDDSIRAEKDIEKFKAKLGIRPFRYLKGHEQMGEGWRDIYNGVKKGLVTGAKYVGKKLLDVAINGTHRLNFSPSVRRLLERYGGEQISQIKVVRTPINGMINKVLNWISMGKFQENLKAMNYDQALHLFFLIKLSSGQIIKIEKNHVIEAETTSNWSPANSESVDVASPGQTLNEFLDKGRKSVGDEVYFIYDSKTQNCQYFIKNNLKANGLWNSTVEKFTLQDSVSIYKGLGLLEKVNKGITDIASKIDHSIFGAGRKRRRGHPAHPVSLKEYKKGF